MCFKWINKRVNVVLNKVIMVRHNYTAWAKYRERHSVGIQQSVLIVTTGLYTAKVNLEVFNPYPTAFPYGNAVG